MNGPGPKLILLGGLLLALGCTAALAEASSRSPGTTAIACGTTRTIGVAAPITGPGAPLGAEQLDWVRYFVASWNRAHPYQRVVIRTGDTKFGVSTAFAVKTAQAFAANPRVLAVVGPANSQEVAASTDAYRRGGLAWISGSASEPGLTGGDRLGYFFRVVHADTVQSVSVADYMVAKLKVKNVHVIVDDGTAHSLSLATAVTTRLRAKGVTVTRDSIAQRTADFSPTIAKIPGKTDVVYIPWQLATDAQAFGLQLRHLGASTKLFGSDEVFVPRTFRIPGAYDSFYPVSATSTAVKAFTKAHSGDGEIFGAASYVAAQVATMAITKACADGKATRAEVRKDIAQVVIPAKASLLGFRVDFQADGDLKHGGYGIYQIQANGWYKPVG